jgi:hypothetical protein
MSLLIYSGLLYLIGISVILAFKPLLMFSKDGKWKEFGIGRSRERYTWMPFWLFAIIWAIISYTIVLIIADRTYATNTTNATNATNESMIDAEDNMEELLNLTKKTKASNKSMKKGYYILKTNETMKNGQPKYIYLGPETPNLHYQDE